MDEEENNDIDFDTVNNHDLHYDKQYDEEVYQLRLDNKQSKFAYKKLYLDIINKTGHSYAYDEAADRLDKELQNKIYIARKKARSRIEKRQKDANDEAAYKEMQEVKRLAKLGQEHKIKPSYIDINGIPRYNKHEE